MRISTAKIHQFIPDHWPVFEFRPLPNASSYNNVGMHRYTEGQWIPDDGEPDLAFAVKGTCLMLELPYKKNIIWQWCTGHWSGYEPNHPRGNAWHYMVREGETEFGGDWKRERHPNSIAGDSGMKFAIKGGYSASGRHVGFHLDDKHIAAGLVRERVSGKLLTLPEQAICIYCGLSEQRTKGLGDGK